MSFKVISRKICSCGKPITSKRFRKFCSKECRIKSYTEKYQPYHSVWQRARQDVKASKPDSNKKQCIICKRWYVQVGTHIVQRHSITAREYREKFDLPLKRGIVPAWYRKLKGEQTVENKTVNNLKKGKRFWFKKGDKRARIKAGKVGWKSKRRPSDEYYE